MRDSHFEQLRAILVDRGISARYADRLIVELEDHYFDVEAERLAAGDGRADAASTARESLGSDASIAAQVLSRPELSGRCCGIRLALRPIALALIAGSWGGGATLAAPAIARWGASIAFGSMVTVALLFAMARTMAVGA